MVLPARTMEQRMTETEQEKNYRCPTCGSVAVDVTEYDGGERVHIYCQEPACGWVHRALFANGSIVNTAKGR